MRRKWDVMMAFASSEKMLKHIKREAHIKSISQSSYLRELVINDMKLKGINTVREEKRLAVEQLRHQLLYICPHCKKEVLSKKRTESEKEAED